MSDYLKYLKNKKLLQGQFCLFKRMEHDACGVGLIATTDGKKSRKIVESESKH